MRLRFWWRSTKASDWDASTRRESTVRVPGTFNPYSVDPVAWMRPHFGTSTVCIACGVSFSTFRKAFEVAVYSDDDVEIFGPFDEACGSRRVRLAREARE